MHVDGMFSNTQVYVSSKLGCISMIARPATLFSVLTNCASTAQCCFHITRLVTPCRVECC